VRVKSRHRDRDRTPTRSPGLFQPFTQADNSTTRKTAHRPRPDLSTQLIETDGRHHRRSSDRKGRTFWFELSLPAPTTTGAGPDLCVRPILGGQIATVHPRRPTPAAVLVAEDNRSTSSSRCACWRSLCYKRRRGRPTGARHSRPSSRPLRRGVMTAKARARRYDATREIPRRDRFRSSRAKSIRDDSHLDARRPRKVLAAGNGRLHQQADTRKRALRGPSSATFHPRRVRRVRDRTSRRPAPSAAVRRIRISPRSPSHAGAATADVPARRRLPPVHANASWSALSVGPGAMPLQSGRRGASSSAHAIGSGSSSYALAAFRRRASMRSPCAAPVPGHAPCARRRGAVRFDRHADDHERAARRARRPPRTRGGMPLVSERRWVCPSR